MTADPLRDVDVWVVLEDGRAQLLAALDDLDEPSSVLPVEDGEWSIRDVIAHVAAWDELYASFLQALAAGRRECEVVASPDDRWAAWNAERLAEAAGAALDALFERMHLARVEMLQALAMLDPALLDEAFASPWGIEDTVRGFMIAQAMHDGAHAHAVREEREARESAGGPGQG